MKRHPERSLDLKVGIFVLAAIVCGLVVVLLLGKKRHVFESRVTLHAAFTDVQGLRPGAPVWLSGVSVGTVSKIGFGRPGEKLVLVDVEIARAMLGRIHADSVASIGSQGLLGDKIIQISLGGPESPPLLPGGAIATTPPADLNKLIDQAAQVIGNAQKVAEGAATAMQAIASPQAIAHFQGSLASLDALLHQAKSGPGLVHGLFYGKRSEEDLRQLTATLNQLALHLDTGVKRLDRVLSSIDGDGRQVVNNLSRAARAIGETASSINHSGIVAHLGGASSDLQAITTQVRSGRGTIGALIVDPTVYERLVTALGGVARSRILRSLVRYAIKRGEKRGEKPLPEPEPLPPRDVNRAKR